MDLLIKGGTVVTATSSFKADVAVKNGKISAIGANLKPEKKTEVVDAKGKMIYFDIISKGSLNSSDMPVRKIVDLSLRHNAKTAFIAHNHPSGTALPSGSDLDTTIVLKSTLATVGVELIDHFIITDDDYVSLRESRLAGNIFYYEK